MAFPPARTTPAAALLAALLFLGFPPGASAAAEEVALERIEIRGAPGQEEAIKSQMRIAEGKSYPAASFDRLLENDVSQLWKWGVFVREVSPREPRGKTVLVLQVEMRLRIASIEFEGLDALDEEDVLPLLLVKRGSATDDSLLQVSCDRLRERYRDEGYRFASVTYELKRRRGARAGLVFKIEEGPRTRVDEIVFLGNRSVRDARLRSVMETKISDLFTPERLLDDALRRDVAAVEQYYREEGWRDARVALEDLAYSDDLERVAVVLRIREGDRYTVTSLAITGNQAVPTEKLLRRVNLRAGLFYRSRLVYGDFESEEKGDFKRIQELYGDLGYLDARIFVEETFDDRAKTAKVVYRIEEGKKVRVRRLLFAGNEKTRDDVMRRLVSIRPGEVFRYGDLERSYRNLEQSRYFGKVDLRFLPTGVPEEKDVLLEVEETRTGDIRFIAAYNQSTQFMGRVELRFRNFDLSRLPTDFDDLLSGRAFSGGGQTLTVQMTAGMEKQMIYSLQFEEPAFFGTRTSFMTSVSKFQRDWGPYLEKSTGGTLLFGRRLTDFLSVNVKYRFTAMELRDI
ncbi:MAG: BamA/TamA family outer membrane protein, partial [Planctomycetes bacterium]|nr:BamA/TamA family outer membrane protein [Planctomycetota bacterium]